MQLKRKEIFICSDSSAAINAVSTVEIKSGLVKECRGALNQPMNSLVRLRNIPCHNPILGQRNHRKIEGNGTSQSKTYKEGEHARLLISPSQLCREELLRLELSVVFQPEENDPREQQNLTLRNEGVRCELI